MALERRNISDENVVGIIGHVSDAGAAITDFDTDLGEPTDNHYNGLLLMFLNGPCIGQVHLIDDYTAVNGNCAFIVGDQWTDVPTNGSQFIILPANGVFAKMIHTRLGAPAGASISADIAVVDGNVDDIETAVGAIEGATTLHNKLTAARAALLDQITALRLAELDAANIPADVDTLKVYCDILDDAVNGLAAIKAEVEGLAGAAMRGTDGASLAASWTAALATALGSYTAVRAALLDQITAARMAELDAANMPTDIDAILLDTGTTLPATLATIAGYLDTEIADIKTQTDKLVGAESADTHAHANDLNWQVYFTLATAARKKVLAIWLDFNLLAQNMNMRLQYQIDGANLRTFWTDTWLTTDEVGVLINIPRGINGDLVLSCQSAVLQGAAIDVPYCIIYQDME